MWDEKKEGDQERTQKMRNLNSALSILYVFFRSFYKSFKFIEMTKQLLH